MHAQVFGQGFQSWHRTTRNDAWVVHLIETHQIRLGCLNDITDGIQVRATIGSPPTVDVISQNTHQRRLSNH